MSDFGTSWTAAARVWSWPHGWYASTAPCTGHRTPRVRPYAADRDTDILKYYSVKNNRYCSETENQVLPHWLVNVKKLLQFFFAEPKRSQNGAKTEPNPRELFFFKNGVFLKFGAKTQRSNQLFYRWQQSTGDSKRIQARVPVTAKYRWQQTNTILRTLIQGGFSCPYEHSELLILSVFESSNVRQHVRRRRLNLVFTRLRSEILSRVSIRDSRLRIFWDLSRLNPTWFDWAQLRNTFPPRIHLSSCVSGNCEHQFLCGRKQSV